MVFVNFVRLCNFRKVIAAWSSGTGSSGIIGSTSWAALTAFGFDPRVALRLLLIVPPIQAAAFWLLLRSHTTQANNNNNNQSMKVDIATIESTICHPNCVLPNVDNNVTGLKAKLKCLPSLVTFVCPLVFVFIFEYICVSGLVRVRVQIKLLFFYAHKLTSVFHSFLCISVRNDLYSEHMVES